MLRTSYLDVTRCEFCEKRKLCFSNIYNLEVNKDAYQFGKVLD